MHVVAFNGSPRKNGNTARLVRHCLDTLESEGISTEIQSCDSRRNSSRPAYGLYGIQSKEVLPHAGHGD